MRDFTFDVAIVGASVAGASLAIHLGRAGLKVALIDKSEFPRRKACGEGVSDIALESLRRIGLDDIVERLEGLPFYSYLLDFNGRSLVFASGPRRWFKGAGIQRYLLDDALIKAARSLSSIDFFLETDVSAIEILEEGVVLQCSTGSEILAKHLVLADGANSRNAVKLGVPVKKGRRPLWGISFILEGEYQKLTGEVLILLKDGFEVYCTPVSETVLNVAFLIGKEKMRYLQDKGIQDDLLQEAKEKCFFRGDVLGRPLTVGPVGAMKRSYRHGSIILVGDVAESLDPISGMGITHAVLSAELAAEALLALQGGNVSGEKVLDEYTINCEVMAAPYRGFTRLTGGLLRSPLRNVLIPALVKTNLPHLIRKSLKYKSSDKAMIASVFSAFLRLMGK